MNKLMNKNWTFISSGKPSRNRFLCWFPPLRWVGCTQRNEQEQRLEKKKKLKKRRMNKRRRGKGRRGKKGGSQNKWVATEAEWKLGSVADRKLLVALSRVALERNVHRPGRVPVVSPKFITGTTNRSEIFFFSNFLNNFLMKLRPQWMASTEFSI